MTAAWPGTLPAYVLSDGYDENYGKQYVESPMDGGAVKKRRRFTRRWDRFSVRMNMDATQAAAFDTFYFTTLAGGTLPFTWVHPRTQSAMTFKFVGEAPKVADLNGIDVTISWTMERQS